MLFRRGPEAGDAEVAALGLIRDAALRTTQPLGRRSP
jgi:hypothetical protein